MKLICFHCAGGSSSMFKDWKIKGVDIIPIDLPGRGSNIGLSRISDFTEMVEFIKKEIGNIISNEQWGVFGHSMGSLFAYEISRININNPQFCILSGINQLNEYGARPIEILKENDETLINKMNNLGGIPQKIINNPMFIKWFAPLLRSDLALVETFQYVKSNKVFPTYLINGRSDLIVETNRWNSTIGRDLDYIFTEGGHFEVLQNPNLIESIISKHL